MYENIKLNTDRTIIENFTRQDIDTLHKIINDEEIMAFVPFTKARSLSECEALMERIQLRYSESTIDCFKGFLLKVCHRKKIIGFIGLFPMTIDPGQREIFYGLLPEFRGLGLGKESVKEVIRYGLEELMFPSIVATIKEDNDISKKLVESVGMTYQYIIDGGDSYDKELLYEIKRMVE